MLRYTEVMTEILLFSKTCIFCFSFLLYCKDFYEFLFFFFAENVFFLGIISEVTANKESFT